MSEWLMAEAIAVSVGEEVGQEHRPSQLLFARAIWGLMKREQQFDSLAAVACHMHDVHVYEDGGVGAPLSPPPAARQLCELECRLIERPMTLRRWALFD